MTKTTTDILNELTEASLVIEELNRAIPEIRKGFQESKAITEEIKERSQNAENLLQDATAKGEKINQDIDTALEKIAEQVKRAEGINKTINIALKKAEALQKQLTDQLTVLSDFEEMKQEWVHMTKRVNALETMYHERLDDMLKKIEELEKKQYYSTERYYSIRELMQIENPLIVVYKGWKNDYCFGINEMDDAMAYGLNYKDGKAESARKAALDQCEYKIYDGPSREKIIRLMNEEKRS